MMSTFRFAGRTKFLKKTPLIVLFRRLIIISVEHFEYQFYTLWIPILHSRANCAVRTDTVLLITRNMFSHMNFCKKIIKSFRDQNVHAVVCVAVLHSNWISIPGLASTALSIILVSSSCVSEDLNRQLHNWLRSGDRFNKAFRKPSFTNA